MSFRLLSLDEVARVHAARHYRLAVKPIPEWPEIFEADRNDLADEYKLGTKREWDDIGEQVFLQRCTSSTLARLAMGVGRLGGRLSMGRSFDEATWKRQFIKDSLTKMARLQGIANPEQATWKDYFEASVKNHFTKLAQG